tara:strand:- start:5547 stop:5729 length:183 start_codon:yes stop_codon:yes gene_type:complete
MQDKDLEQIQTLDINVTAESMDAHVICLKDNGYKVEKTFTSWTKYTMAFLLGAYIIQAVI